MKYGTVFVLFCLLHHAQAGIPEKQTPVVFVQKILQQDLFDQLSYPARLVPTRAAALLSEVDGIVKAIAAPLGKTVGKDETVMILGNTDPIYRYAPFRVLAPLRGVVSAIEVTEGSRVTKGQKLGAVTDPRDVKITLDVAASDLFEVRKGLKGELKVASEEKPLTVRVLGVSPFVDPATGTATVELAPELKAGEPARLPPGLVGRVTFRVREHKGIQIPDQAIVYRGQTPAVRLVEGTKVRIVPVKLGSARRGEVEVVSGIPDGATLVVRASTFVADGETVTVQSGETGKL